MVGMRDRQAEQRGPTACELCGRPVKRLTRHHLIPRTRHNNRRTKREFGGHERHQRIAWLCRPCHDHVHNVFDEKELERHFNTIASLRERTEIARFVEWIADKPAGFRPRKGKRSRRRRRGRP